MLEEIVSSEDKHNVFGMVYFCAWCLKCVKKKTNWNKDKSYKKKKANNP